MITGTLEELGGTQHLVLHRTVNAPVEQVWDAFTVSPLLARWFGSWEGDPGAGTVEVSMVFEEESGSMTYMIEACEAPHHLRVHSMNEDPAQVWTVDVQLHATGDDTQVRFAQPLPDGVGVEYLGTGWEFYLDRMEESLHTGETATAQWETYEPLIQEYRASLG